MLVLYEVLDVIFLSNTVTENELFVGSDDAFVVVEGGCVVGEGALADGKQMDVFLRPCGQEICTDIVLFRNGEVYSLFTFGVLVAKYMVVGDCGWKLRTQLHGVDDGIKVWGGVRKSLG